MEISLKHTTDKQWSGAAAVILMSHLGRPDGKVVVKDSLKPVAAELEKLMGLPVKFLPDCVGPEVEAECKKASNGRYLRHALRQSAKEESH